MDAHGTAPHRRGYGLAGLLSYRRDKVGMLLALMRDQGDVARVRVGAADVVLVTHPRDIRQVLVVNAKRYRQSRSYEQLKPFVGDGLVTSDGERWAAQRHRTLAAMRTLEMAPLFDRAGRQIADRFDRTVPGATTFELVTEMRRLSMTIARSVILGIDRPLDGEAFRVDFDEAYAYVLRRLESFVPAPAWLPTRARRRFRAGKAGLDAAIDAAMRYEVPDDGPRDLLTALIEEGARTGGAAGILGDEVLTLFLAGYETMASALAWAVLLSCGRPEVWEAVGAEVAARCGAGLPRYADLTGLEFTWMVAQETLRLFPPIWAFSREARAAHELRGVAVAAGTKVAVSPYCTHRRTDFWDRPEEFDPSRFGGGGAAPAGPAYLPFGLGPHHCLGSTIAVPAMVLVLALMARRFTLTGTGSATGNSGQFGRPEGGVILRPPKGTRVHVATR